MLVAAVTERQGWWLLDFGTVSDVISQDAHGDQAEGNEQQDQSVELQLSHVPHHFPQLNHGEAGGSPPPHAPGPRRAWNLQWHRGSTWQQLTKKESAAAEREKAKANSYKARLPEICHLSQVTMALNSHRSFVCFLGLLSSQKSLEEQGFQNLLSNSKSDCPSVHKQFQLSLPMCPVSHLGVSHSHDGTFCLHPLVTVW